MGFINHSNAAPAKKVLSAGRYTSRLTATAGRKALVSEQAFADRLLIVFGFFFFLMSGCVASGQGRREHTLHPSAIFQLCRQKNQTLELKEGNLQCQSAGEEASWICWRLVELKDHTFPSLKLALFNQYEACCLMPVDPLQ